MSRKARISAFCVLNIVAILWANTPEAVVAFSQRAFVQMGSPPAGGPCVECGRYWLSRYAHLAGFGGAWKLFTGLPRYDYWITVDYVYADGTRVHGRRPYPRHAWTALTPIFNHRENKIDLNLLTFDSVRIAFARWLCRQEEAQGRAITSVQLIAHRRDIPRLAEAGAPPPVETADQPYEVVLCGDGSSPAPS